MFVEDGYEIADTPDAVAIVAIDAEDRVVLVRQQRIATGGKLLELPAGLIDEGEEPLEARSASCARKRACAAAGGAS